jgi:hypothetical protein
MTSSPVTPTEIPASRTRRQRRSGPAYLRGLPAWVWQDALNQRVPHTAAEL